MLRSAFKLASLARLSANYQIGGRLSWSRNYAANDVMFGDEARALMLKGVEGLANVVRVSIGPKGRNVLLEQSSGSPKVTKDGVRIAEGINFKDRVKNIGAGLVKHVANATNVAVGDGTSCATILTHAIYSEGCKSASAGINAMDLKCGISMAVESVVTNLKSRARMITTCEEIKQVGTISANGDRHVGELISKGMEKVGSRGIFSIIEGNTLDNRLEIVEGVKIDSGYLLSDFVTNEKNKKCEMDDPLIFIHEQKIYHLEGLGGILETAVESERPLLIIAEDFDDDPIETLKLNMKDAGLKVCVIKAPLQGYEGSSNAYPDYRRSYMEDLAILTGAEVFTELLGYTVDDVSLEMLGTCKKVIVSKDDTMIFDGAGDKKAIKERYSLLRYLIKSSDSATEKGILIRRLGRLSGVVAVLEIGGASEGEISEKCEVVLDALSAVQAALEEGILPGGGIALLYASKELEKLQTDNFDQKTGVQIIQNALKAPVLAIAGNAGVEGAVIVEKLLNQDDPNLGYDAAKGEYVDMVKHGIIDPLKVIRTALSDAASVSSLMATTEAVVLKPEARWREIPKNYRGVKGVDDEEDEMDGKAWREGVENEMDGEDDDDEMDGEDDDGDDGMDGEDDMDEANY